MPTVTIQPEPLKWARELRFLSLTDAAERLKVDSEKLRIWESQTTDVSISQFEKLASTYRIPSAVLFSPFVPNTPILPDDFRTFSSAPPRHSFEFSVAFSRSTDKARRMSILRQRLGKDSTNIPSYDPYIGPEAMAVEERKRMNLSPLDVLDWDGEHVFHRYRALIEKVGIPVFQEKFPTTDCRGFTFFYDGIGPVIVVNREEEFKKAKAFTVLHEYGHALKREYSLSDQDNHNPSEAYCNKFAAAFMMPRELITHMFGPTPNSPDENIEAKLKYRASRMKVSQHALAIRLENLGYAPKGFSKDYGRYYGFKARKKSEGGNPNATLLSDAGGAFVTDAAEAIREGLISPSDLTDLFGERITSEVAVIEAAERQLKYAAKAST